MNEKDIKKHLNHYFIPTRYYKNKNKSVDAIGFIIIAINKDIKVAVSTSLKKDTPLTWEWCLERDTTRFKPCSSTVLQHSNVLNFWLLYPLNCDFSTINTDDNIYPNNSYDYSAEITLSISMKFYKSHNHYDIELILNNENDNVNNDVMREPEMPFSPDNVISFFRNGIIAYWVHQKKFSEKKIFNREEVNTVLEQIKIQ